MDITLTLANIESDEGKRAIIALHVDGIPDFIQQRTYEPLYIGIINSLASLLFKRGWLFIMDLN